MASNIFLKSKETKRKESQPDTNMTIRSKLLNYLKKIKENSQRIEQFKNEYKSTNDFTKEKKLREDIGELFDEINKTTTCANKMIKSMKEDIVDRKHIFNDPNSEDTNTRFTEETIAAVQIELYHQIKAFNKNQLEIKNLFKSKMHRQILIYDPKIQEERITELMNDSSVRL
jgi:hypothetical protein